MSKLVIKSSTPGADGCLLKVTPESANWTYVGFAAHRLESGNSFTNHSHDRETCLVLLSGKASVHTGQSQFNRIGVRDSVFDGPPTAVYVPAGVEYTVTAETALEFAVCSAPGDANGKVRLIEPGAHARETRGRGTNTRYVQDILPEADEADSLLVVEVITPGGNWSSYPPHKHDTDAVPAETSLEETYYHRLKPSQGFAFQRIYTDDRSLDETLAVENGDCVLVPRGYHPVGTPHGYDLYYLNVMAGPKRRWIFKNDPDHDWIAATSKSAEREG